MGLKNERRTEREHAGYGWEEKERGIVKRKKSLGSSFVFPRRLASIFVPTHAARRSQQLILFSFLFFTFLNKLSSKSHYGENRTQGPTTLGAFEGDH